MIWLDLQNFELLEKIRKDSFSSNQYIFKHSTRCYISLMIKKRLELSSELVSIYLLDLLSFRNISNYIAEIFNVEHQSPQLLILKNGKCDSHFSHNSITQIIKID